MGTYISEGEQPRSNGRAGFSATMVVEPDRPHAEVAVSAYCRELCGPASDRAVMAVLGALPGDPEMIAEAELLHTTRATAARFAFAGLNGSRGKLTAKCADECVPTPDRLAGRAAATLAPAEEGELTKHLRYCLPCNAIRIKHDRAERGFATLWSCPTALDPTGDVTRRAATAALEAPASVAPPAPAPARDLRVLDSAHAKSAVDAYCRELCSPVSAKRAIAASLGTVEIAGRSATVPQDELLRVTRSAAAEQASLDIGAQLESERSSAECADATVALAALANGELETPDQRDLRDHIQNCLICHATRIKMTRAERAFTTMGTAAPGIESWLYLPAESMPKAAVAEPTPRRQARRPAVAPPAARPPRAAARPLAAAAPLSDLLIPTPVPAPGPLPLFPPTAAGSRRAPAAPAAPAAPRRPARTGGARVDRPVRRRRLAAVVLLAAVAVAAVFALGGHSSTPSASQSIRAASKTPAHARTPATTVTRVVKNKPKVAVKPKPKAKPKPKPVTHHKVTVHHAATSHHTTAASKPAVVVSAPATPRASTPATPKKTVTPTPAASKPSTPVKSTTPSVSSPGSNLPAQSAPTKGIGG